MARGSAIVPVRMSEDMIRDIDAAINRANLNRHEAPYDRSSWIRKAIIEKMEHGIRSRKPRLTNATSISNVSAVQQHPLSRNHQDEGKQCSQLD
jgi:hypothetical protein